MKISYNDLYTKTKENNISYKEGSSILSYYIIKTILMSDYIEFFSWCIKNNENIIQFNIKNNNGYDSLDKYYSYIKKTFTSKNMLSNIECTEYLFKDTYETNELKLDYKILLLNNLRMTINELE